MHTRLRLHARKFLMRSLAHRAVGFLNKTDAVMRVLQINVVICIFFLCSSVCRDSAFFFRNV